MQWTQGHSAFCWGYTRGNRHTLLGLSPLLRQADHYLPAWWIVGSSRSVQNHRGIILYSTYWTYCCLPGSIILHSYSLSHTPFLLSVLFYIFYSKVTWFFFVFPFFVLFIIVASDIILSLSSFPIILKSCLFSHIFHLFTFYHRCYSCLLISTYRYMFSRSP